MYGLKKIGKVLRVNLLGPGPRLIKKKNLHGRLLTKVEKHCFTPPNVSPFSHPVGKGVTETLKKNIVTDLFTNLRKLLQKEGKCRKI